MKHEHDGKVNTHISFVSGKLQKNCQRSFNKVVMKFFCKISFKDFGISKLQAYFFVYAPKPLRTRYVDARIHNFSSLVFVSFKDRKSEN